jgi:16S rRNA (uracil1498-N3)-methyltransferase
VFVVDPERLRSAVAGTVVPLDGPEGRHAAAVRRLRAGEPIQLVDGSGARVDGVVEQARRDGLDVRVLALQHEPAPQPRIVVVQALPKGERGELAVETLTEVGVDVVVPWAAARCVAQWRGERGEKALRRWRSTSTEAGKQSRRARFPEVTALASTSDVVGLLSEAALGVVLHEEAAQPLTGLRAPAQGEVVVVVGPEGGIAPEELAAFAGAGAGAYRLGSSVLRTSTAGVVAAALLLAASGRWGGAGSPG